MSFHGVIAAVLGLVAHWLLGDVTAKDTVYYIMKQHAIRAFLATASSHPTIAETLSILDVDDTDKEVASRKKAVEQVSPWADAAEKATFAAIIFSLVWSVVYPLIIRGSVRSLRPMPNNSLKLTRRAGHSGMLEAPAGRA